MTADQEAQAGDAKPSQSAVSADGTRSKKGRGKQPQAIEIYHRAGRIVIDGIVCLAAIGVALHVSFNPNVMYPTAGRAMLYALFAVMVAIVIGRESAVYLKVKGPGVVLVAAGAFAAFLVTLYALDHIAKPHFTASVYKVYRDEVTREPVLLRESLSWEVQSSSSAPVDLTHYVDGNTLVIIFPDQAPEARLTIRNRKGDDTSTFQLYAHTTRSREIFLNKPD